MMPYEKFEAWKITHKLALEVYRVTEQWPRSERYEVTAQTRRAALSAPTNIAEGAAKRDLASFVVTSIFHWDPYPNSRTCFDSARIEASLTTTHFRL